MALEDIVSSLFGNNIYNTTPPTGSIMYDYFLPFVIIWVVFYGILSAINLFRHKPRINLILSVGLTLMMTATPYWFGVGQFISEWGAWTSVIIFIVVFTFGVVMWGLGRGKEYYEGSPIDTYVKGGAPKRALDNLLEEIRRMEAKRDLLESDTPQYKALEDQIKVRKERAKELARKLGLSIEAIGL